ncbi:unnamed protein product [Durusdinium trenchii]|uniref:Uncharacterized protein n=1 Tax=Durusdinium trenchii TaxID=1381693 RepID=A0ABP0SHV7_9DINO
MCFYAPPAVGGAAWRTPLCCTRRSCGLHRRLQPGGGCHLSNCSIQLSCGNETEQIWFEPLLPCDQEEESCHSASLGSAPVEYCLRRQQSECICMFVRVRLEKTYLTGCVDSCTSQGQLEKMAALGSLLVFMVTGAAYLVQPGFIYSVPPVLELGLF